ncbi:hypothetical protein MTO96_025500 [Rhipicephalus appendiculatus]
MRAAFQDNSITLRNGSERRRIFEETWRLRSSPVTLTPTRVVVKRAQQRDSHSPKERGGIPRGCRPRGWLTEDRRESRINPDVYSRLQQQVRPVLPADDYGVSPAFRGGRLSAVA